MNNAFALKTYGDPLGTTRIFLETIWQNYHLDKLLISSNGSAQSLQKPNILTDHTQLMDINPFKPLMTENIAKYIPDYLDTYSNEKIAVILKPCEIRALNGMRNFQEINVNNLLTICFDCLGTYSIDEYQFYLKRKGSPENLVQTTLQFARQGGINAYRYRSACQMCVAPQADCANINIEVLGYPIRQYIIIRCNKQQIIESFRTDKVNNIIVDQKVKQQREWMLAKIAQRNGQVRERIKQALSDVLPTSIDTLILQFKSCVECNRCIDVCPICMAALPNKKNIGQFDKDDLINWIFACAGCGMCEQVCPDHHPLSLIFRFIRDLFNEPATSSI